MVLAWTLLGLAYAGLGPDDVVVAFNADDPEAVETAVHYALARDLPEAQLCGLEGIDPLQRSIALIDAVEGIIAPLQACIASLPDPSAIDAVVTVRGLPYRVELPDGGYVLSLESALQIAGTTHPGDGEPLLGRPQARQGSTPIASILNPVYIAGGMYPGDMTASFGASGWYVTSPRVVRGEGDLGPYVADRDFTNTSWNFGRALYIVSRLDGFDHTDARDLVDRAVLADSAPPTAPFLCMRGSEAARGVRDAECEHAVRMLQAQGREATWIDTFDPELSEHELIAYFTGTANLRGAIDGLTYAPGAIVDNITSFGAAPANFFCTEDGQDCPASESQTSIARFVRAGATAAHGTVAEPLNNVFPNAGLLLLYAQGFTLGESALYNQRFLYWQNLWLGDPLVAPFAERPSVSLAEESRLDAPLDALVDSDHPHGIAELVIYVDGEPLTSSGSSWPTLEELGYLEGDEVEVLVVATAGTPEPLSVDGWPATEPVGFDPAPKGWSRGLVRVGPPAPTDPDDPDDEGCGCAAPGSTGWLGLTALLPALLLRRRRRIRRSGISRG